ncbi:MAG: CHAT domain-containing protein [Cyanobacteria bacterium J06633_8]
MGKRVVLKIGDGDFNQGFPVTLQIGEEGLISNIQKDAKLPGVPINVKYKQWQDIYCDLGGRRRSSSSEREHYEITPETVVKCEKNADDLRINLQKWFYSEEFRPIRDKLIKNLNQNEDIRVVIQTQNKELQRLPWHLWDFFKDYRQAEVVISSPEYEFKAIPNRPKSKIKILVILGNSEGINVKEDEENLRKIPKADICFLVEPTRKQLNDKLYEERWDILFFAGHSDSQGDNETGRIYLNKKDRLTISELKNSLKKSIANGLKIAIFNSCNGLGLARDLGGLQIPQIIFMREPVPDKVAQEFLNYFIYEFVAGKSVHLAVREAREKLQGIEDEFLYATWLPVIFQNSEQAPQNLRDILNQPSIWQWRTGISAAAVIVISFIFLFLNPNFNIEITRFLLAIVAGISGYLLLGNFGLEAVFPVLSKRLIRWLGAFITVISVFFLSLRLPTLDADTILQDPITYRNLTALNNWSTLTLSILNPSLKDDFTLKVLSEALNVDSFPLVYQNNPVFENIERFKLESGNEQTLNKLKNQFPTILYQRNLGNQTLTGSVTPELNDDLFAKEIIKQNKNNYVKNTLSTTGEDEYSSFYYAPIMASFQSSEENAKYSSISTYGQNKYTITQFPKMSDIKKTFTIDGWTVDGNSNLNSIWINRIIENNPELRGFIGFNYQFTNNLNQALFLDCGDQVTKAPINRDTSSPYIKFVDVENIRLSPIEIQSIKFDLLDKKPYELTISDSRSKLFQSEEKKAKEDTFKNIFIEPGHHLFIPIEFGFDTKPIRKALQIKPEVRQENISRLSKSTMYVAKPVLKSEFEQVESKISKGFEINNFLTTSTNLSDEFVSNISSPTQLIDLLPKRFAVGSILNVKSLKVNGKYISIDSPSDNPPFAISRYAAEGSCPYLIVYDSEQGSWKELGTVLYGRKYKSLQAEEIHQLGDSSSKIKLEEREPEITYIDSLAIVYTDPITKIQAEKSLSIPQLLKNDEDYFVLHQGESLDIDLRKLVPNNSTDLKLKVNGYYEIIGDNLPQNKIGKSDLSI